MSSRRELEELEGALDVARRAYLARWGWTEVAPSHAGATVREYARDALRLPIDLAVGFTLQAIEPVAATAGNRA